MASPSAESPVSHLRSEQYSYRVPTPPRIVVPPPSINAATASNFALAAPRNHPVLSRFSYDSMTTSSLLEWTYERRRDAQPILPFLYLGPLNAAKDRSFLQREGITMMLGIHQKRSFQSKIMSVALRVANELGIQQATVDLTSDRELVGLFPTINHMVNQHLLHIHQLHLASHGTQPSMGKVLLFCESGNERSAAATAAYLMETHDNVDYIRAMQTVQGQRFCVNFDDGIKRLLQSYWDILEARRDVLHADSHRGNINSNSNSNGNSNSNDNDNGNSNSNSNSNNTALPAPHPPRTTKRTLDRDSDDDMDMDSSGQDAERFRGRAFAPFVDMGNQA